MACTDRGSFFEEFLQQTADMDASARAAFLESPPAGAPDIERAHEVGGGRVQPEELSNCRAEILRLFASQRHVEKDGGGYPLQLHVTSTTNRLLGSLSLACHAPHSDVSLPLIDRLPRRPESSLRSLERASCMHG